MKEDNAFTAHRRFRQVADQLKREKDNFRYPEQQPDYTPKNMGQLKLTSFIFDQLQDVNTVWRIARDAQDWQTVQEVEVHEQQLYRDLDSWDRVLDRDGWSFK